MFNKGRSNIFRNPSLFQTPHCVFFVCNLILTSLPQKPNLKFCYVLPFCAWSVFFGQIHHSFAEQPEKNGKEVLAKIDPSFLTYSIDCNTWRKRKREREQKQKVSWIHCPNIPKVSSNRGYEVLRKWTRCFLSNTAHRLFMATTNTSNWPQ